MRTVGDLIDDLGRLEGPRLDETVFELFHRGPRALDRLAAYWESSASGDTKSRIRASVQSQWTRIQEILTDTSPRAFSSTGMRLALSMGPADSLARRTQRCIDQGRTDTATAIASALSALGNDNVDQAVLEARIAMAAGRPEQAMSRLGGYCQAPPQALSHSTACEWFARAAIAAGRPVESFAQRLRLEPDVGAVSHIMMWLADADDAGGLAECIAQAARTGEQALWQLLAESTAAALDDALGVHVNLISDFFGMCSDIEGFVDAIWGVAMDMESSLPSLAGRSMAGELVSLASDACDMLASAARLFSAVKARPEGSGNDTTEIISSLLDGAEPRPRCDYDGQGFSWTWNLAHGVPQDALRKARLVALMHGARWRAFSVAGEHTVSVSPPASPRTPAPSITTASELGPVAIERILKSLPPPDAAHEIISAIRNAQVDHAEGLLDGACGALLRIEDVLRTITDVASDASAVHDAARHAVAEARSEMERWSCRAARTRGAPEDVLTESPSPAAATDEWILPDELDCSPEAYQALRTAHLLITQAGASESLPPEQAGLPVFLLQKAVQIEVERRLSGALASHRLKPGVLAATRDRGKRRRELDPDFMRSAVQRAPRGISQDRVRGGLERLAARVLDGSSRALSTDPFLAGLALVYLDPLGDPEKSTALGLALLAMGEAAAAATTTAAGDAPSRAGLCRLEQAALEVLSAMSLPEGGEGR